MKNIIVRALISLAIILALLLIYAATKPDTFRVERSMDVKAPPEKIALLITNFHNWGSWSPYEKRDLAMKKTFTGAGSGVGAVYEWDGNNNIGAGRMEISSISPSKITIKLDFLKPFEGHNTAEFILETKSDSTTHVTWAMHGPTLFIGKIMSVFFSMDHMIGNDFETGLATMKALAEK